MIPASSGWPDHVAVTGWYFFNSNKHALPSVELETFLKAGDPPVCISFGSMVNREAEKVDRIVRESLAQTKNRGVILSGWSQVEHRSSENILYLDAVPHDLLLPHCKMIIHHGGQVQPRQACGREFQILLYHLLSISHFGGEESMRSAPVPLPFQ